MSYYENPTKGHDMLKVHLRSNGGVAFCAVRPGKTQIVTTKRELVTCKYCQNEMQRHLDQFGYYQIIHKHGVEVIKA